MGKAFEQYHSELQSRLRELDAEIESSNGNVYELRENRKEILRQIEKVKRIINERSDTFIIKTKKGYLTANSKYTDKIYFAYTYDEDEAVRIARKLGGWLETLPK